MMKLLSTITAIIIVTTCSVIGKGTVSASCDPGWTAFSDEKCFKLIDQFVTREDAESICLQEVPDADDSSIHPLLTIKSEEEQEFLRQFIFEDTQIVDNIWLGATRVYLDGNYSTGTNDFEWQDGTALDYANWHEGNPSDIEDHKCTQMVPKGAKEGDCDGVVDKGIVDGLWMNVACSKRNLVVCQKLQTWPLIQLQKSFIEFRKKSIENPVPIGFIYVQLPSQPMASEVWPAVKWDDVTSDYAGLFFRAEGGQSAGFGDIQDEGAPKIDTVQHNYCAGHNDICKHPTSIKLPTDGWSEWMYLSYNYYVNAEVNTEVIRFNVADGEVRPQNTAIRIWKRVG